MKVNRIETIFSGNTAFTENLEYSDTVPYSLIEKKIESKEVTAPYSCPTLELLLLFDVHGTLFYGLQALPVDGNQAFLIPPNIVHNTDLTCTHGKKIVLEFSLEHMKKYIHLDGILNLYNTNILELNSIYIEEFDDLHKCIKNLIRYDGDFIRCFKEILTMFEIMIRATQKEKHHISLDYSKVAVFQKLIDWTISNIDQNITSKDAASIVGFTNAYFCRYFKQITGMTYIECLQYLRVNRAQYLLSTGHSVSECCYACGYSNISYFIRLFRKHTGMTMLQYSKKYIRDI